MTDQLQEQLSAFIDNELTEEEGSLFVRRLTKDDEFKAGVSRFALIGEAMRGELLAADVQLSQRIQTALADESTAVSADTVNATSSWPAWLRPVSGLAVAATVAAVAVLSMQGFDGPDNTEFPANTVADITAKEGVALLPVDVPRLKLPAVRPVSVVPQSRMDQYLLRHREYANGFGRQSVMGIRDMGGYTVAPVPARTDQPVPADSE
ncbi:MAG: sigma-E factor negative regulatory protein [Gammaproteobacteria bacterium]